MFAQKPNDVLDQLVVHAGRAELGQVKHNAKIVRHLFEAFGARSLLVKGREQQYKSVKLNTKDIIILSFQWSDRTYQTMDNEFGQLIDVPFRRVVVLGGNINYRPTSNVPMVQHPRLVCVLCHQLRLTQILDPIRLPPLVRFQDGL